MIPKLKNSWLIALISVCAGAVYGIINYFLFRKLEGLMAPSFLFLVPLVVGLVAALLTPEERPIKAYQNAALSILVIAIITTLWQYESLFCWVILAPIALLAAAIGAFIVNMVRYWSKSKARVLFGLVILPAVAFQFENAIPAETIFKTTHTSILIEAPAHAVWQEIKSVSTISASEYRDSWTHLFGLPRPLAATLSYEGVGGMRIAGFSNGLSFYEKVIGGQFVDVISGRYTIEEISDSKSLLHLTSTQRLSSKLNSYAGFWVNAVMADLQNTILKVIKHRSEKELS